MKHHSDLTAQGLEHRALPDAPLAMPRQSLDAALPWFGLMRLFFRAASRRA